MTILRPQRLRGLSRCASESDHLQMMFKMRGCPEDHLSQSWSWWLGGRPMFQLKPLNVLEKDNFKFSLDNSSAGRRGKILDPTPVEGGTQGESWELKSFALKAFWGQGKHTHWSSRAWRSVGQQWHTGPSIHYMWREISSHWGTPKAEPQPSLEFATLQVRKLHLQGPSCTQSHFKAQQGLQWCVELTCNPTAILRKKEPW